MINDSIANEIRGTIAITIKMKTRKTVRGVLAFFKLTSAILLLLPVTVV